MSETYEKVTVLSEGFTVSKIVWRRFKSAAPGLVERTLDHNPGLAALGPILPVGTVFELVIPSPDEERQTVPVRRIWGMETA